MDESKNPGKCELCSTAVDERCGDQVCRKCHKSLDFESCVDGSWVKELRRRNGLTDEDEEA